MKEIDEIALIHEQCRFFDEKVESMLRDSSIYKMNQQITSNSPYRRFMQSLGTDLFLSTLNTMLTLKTEQFDYYRQHLIRMSTPTSTVLISERFWQSEYKRFQDYLRNRQDSKRVPIHKLEWKKHKKEVIDCIYDVFSGFYDIIDKTKSTKDWPRVMKKLHKHYYRLKLDFNLDKHYMYEMNEDFRFCQLSFYY